jgi:hypothetical protein
MSELATLTEGILAARVIDEAAVEAIRRVLAADNQVPRADVELLLALRSAADSVCPAFEGLFLRVVKAHVLHDGFIDAEEASWLRKVLFADGTINEVARAFLLDLKREARRTSPEFQILYGECMG